MVDVLITIILFFWGEITTMKIIIIITLFSSFRMNPDK